MLRKDINHNIFWRIWLGRGWGCGVGGPYREWESAAKVLMSIFTGYHYVNLPELVNNLLYVFLSDFLKSLLQLLTFSSHRHRARGQSLENPDRAKNESDCKIRYRALLEKKINKIFLDMFFFESRTMHVARIHCECLFRS